MDNTHQEPVATVRDLTYYYIILHKITLQIEDQTEEEIQCYTNNTGNLEFLKRRVVNKIKSLDGEVS